MTFNVSVTQEDITGGTPVRPHSCPLALAINRALPAGYRASVIGPFFKLYAKDGNYDVLVATVNLPDHVKTFAKHFDQGNPVSPVEFSFEAEL